jgi:hypothetical protein
VKKKKREEDVALKLHHIRDSSSRRTYNHSVHEQVTVLNISCNLGSKKPQVITVNVNLKGTNCQMQHHEKNIKTKRLSWYYSS